LAALNLPFNLCGLWWRVGALGPGVLPARAAQGGGRARPGRRRGAQVSCADPATWEGAAVAAAGASPRYGTLAITAWHRVDQQLTSQSAGWEGAAARSRAA